MDRSVLLIDDDTALLGVLERAFRRAGYAVMVATSASDGLERYTRDACELVLLDLNLPDLSGLQVLERLRSVNPDVVAIMLTGQADVHTAVAAMRAGAENFLPKPVDIPHLYAAADRAYEKIELQRRTGYLESRLRADEPPQPSPEQGAMGALDAQLSLIAPTASSVLLLGETGTGKSWTARRIHALSTRSRGPFVELNAATLRSTFLDSELFGHEKGAFTDARTMKRGLFEVADGGTLFLDEIGDLSPQLQPKLLHVIETGRFRRLGGTRELQSDTRLVAATNVDLVRAVEHGRFREDLYYRLAVMPMRLPPLRERQPGEIISLATDLLEQLQQRASGRRRSLSDAAAHHLVTYHWPGNIRELRNVLERALILAAGHPTILASHLPPEVAGATPVTSTLDAAEAELTLEEVERRHIHRVLERFDGNRSRAARSLGISRAGLYKKMQRLGLEA